MRKFVFFPIILIIGNAAKFDVELAKKALEYSATAYAEDPTACLLKQNATLILKERAACDRWGDECWGMVTLDDEWIVVSFRGTRTRLQLVVELLVSMTEPKKKLFTGGSVQHYFYVALSKIWKPIKTTVRKLKITYPEKKILFTGHSLGGSLASLASTVFAARHPHILDKIHLITFGQPRVGNFGYATAHDNLVKNSWRITHRYDIVPHVPYCFSVLWYCLPFLNLPPYHHGTEVWFPNNMTNQANYTICNGKPKNEDADCSNAAYFLYNIYDHAYYFEHNVSEYGRNQCVDTIPKSK